MRRLFEGGAYLSKYGIQYIALKISKKLSIPFVSVSLCVQCFDRSKIVRYMYHVSIIYTLKYNLYFAIIYSFVIILYHKSIIHVAFRFMNMCTRQLTFKVTLKSEQKPQPR